MLVLDKIVIDVTDKTIAIGTFCGTVGDNGVACLSAYLLPKTDGSSFSHEGLGEVKFRNEDVLSTAMVLAGCGAEVAFEKGEFVIPNQRRRDKMYCMIYRLMVLCCLRMPYNTLQEFHMTILNDFLHWIWVKCPTPSNYHR